MFARNEFHVDGEPIIFIQGECNNCGKLILTNVNKPRKFCRLACITIYRNEHRLAGKAKNCPPPQDRICMQCRMVFKKRYVEIMRSNKDFCSTSCSQIWHQGSNHQRYGKKCALAKPARYNGMCFRSKWEAELAKYLDSKSIRWYYEWKRFYFKDCSYLPDFYLPDYDLYVEVKGLMRPEGAKRISRFMNTYGNLIVVGRDFKRVLEVVLST